MTWTVFNKTDQVFILPAVSPRFLFIKLPAHRPYNLKVAFLITATYVVGLTTPAFVEDEVNGIAVVQYIQPVPDVAACAIHRNGFSSQAFPDDGGNEFLCVLPGAVIVGAVARRNVHPICMVVSPDDMVRGSLTGAVRTVWRIRRFLCEVSGLT